MPYTDDPLADYDRRLAQEENWLEKRPICDYCQDHIQDDFYYEINGEVLCKSCLDTHYMKAVDDFD